MTLRPTATFEPSRRADRVDHGAQLIPAPGVARAAHTVLVFVEEADNGPVVVDQ